MRSYSVEHVELTEARSDRSMTRSCIYPRLRTDDGRITRPNYHLPGDLGRSWLSFKSFQPFKMQKDQDRNLSKMINPSSLAMVLN